MVVALLHDVVELAPVEQAHALQRRVEVQVGQLARLPLARDAVEDRHVHQVSRHRRQPVAPVLARTQTIQQQRPAARDLVVVEPLELAKAEVHADHGAHAPHAEHHVGRKVVEGAAVAEQVAIVDHRRQRTGDRNAGQQRALQVAALQPLFARLGVVGGDAEVALPQVFDVGVAAKQLIDRALEHLAQPLALDQRQHRQQIEVAGRVDAEGLARNVDRDVGRAV